MLTLTLISSETYETVSGHGPTEEVTQQREALVGSPTGDKDTTRHGVGYYPLQPNKPQWGKTLNFSPLTCLCFHRAKKPMF